MALPHPDAHPDEEVPDGLERKFKSPGRKSTQRLRDHTRWVGGGRGCTVTWGRLPTYTLMYAGPAIAGAGESHGASLAGGPVVTHLCRRTER